MSAVQKVAMSTAGRDRAAADLAPQPRHQGLDGVALRLIAPVDVFAQFALRDDASSVMREIAQQPELQRGKIDRLSGDQDPQPAGVDLDVAEIDERRRVAADPPKK